MHRDEQCSPIVGLPLTRPIDFFAVRDNPCRWTYPLNSTLHPVRAQVVPICQSAIWGARSEIRTHDLDSDMSPGGHHTYVQPPPPAIVGIVAFAAATLGTFRIGGQDSLTVILLWSNK